MSFSTRPTAIVRQHAAVLGAVLWLAINGTASAQKQVATIPLGMNKFLYGLAFSPDGGTLAVKVGELRLYDTATRRLVATFRSPDVDLSRVFSGMLAFTPDGKHLIVSGDAASYKGGKKLNIPKGTIRVEVWDIKTRKRLRDATFPDELGRVGFILPGSTELLLCGFKAVVRVDLKTLKEVSRFPIRQPFGYVDLSADGKLLAVSGTDGTLAVQETAKGKLVMSVEVAKPKAKVAGRKVGHFMPCAFAPNAKSVTVGGGILQAAK